MSYEFCKSPDTGEVVPATGFKLRSGWTPCAADGSTGSVTAMVVEAAEAPKPVVGVVEAAEAPKPVAKKVKPYASGMVIPKAE